MQLAIQENIIEQSGVNNILAWLMHAWIRAQGREGGILCIARLLLLGIGMFIDLCLQCLDEIQDGSLCSMSTRIVFSSIKWCKHVSSVYPSTSKTFYIIVSSIIISYTFYSQVSFSSLSSSCLFVFVFSFFFYCRWCSCYKWK